MNRLFRSGHRNYNPEPSLREYLIVISPPAKIVAMVKNLKKEFLENFGKAKFLGSQAHISLSHFLIESTPEATIQKELYDFLKSWKPFEIRISGFDKFDTQNTLFLQVASEEIIKLQNHMITVLRQKAKIGKSDTPKLRNPHITIASNIPDSQFESSFDYFRDKQYPEKFLVDKITVLRRAYSLEKLNYNIAFEVNLAG